ncbi:MAG: phosphonate ABC transporter, permease protein PhnE, partial [Desulfohalobiaceae bacterium]|nr:phosphonate ABC transporter, permease protein PhnE [Desulfohalobiaceae bacterium]
MKRSASSNTHPEIWKKFTPAQTLLRYIGYLVMVLIAVWALSDLDITWFYFLDAHKQIADMAVRMWPPDLAFITNLTGPLIETIHIATLGTAGSVIIAFPIAFLAARNTT